MLEVLKAGDAEFLEAQGDVIKTRFKPKFWDSESIAELLQEAALGFPSSKRFRDAGKIALKAFQQEKRKGPRFPKGIQTMLYQIFLKALYEDTIPKLIRKRLRVLAPEISLPSSFDVNALREAVSAYPKYIIFTLVRSWANAWTTSIRMHEPHRWICLFGCAGKPDDMHHYLRCVRMWRGLKTALKATPTTPPS
jgi:hypothetical protein